MCYIYICVDPSIYLNIYIYIQYTYVSYVYILISNSIYATAMFRSDHPFKLIFFLTLQQDPDLKRLGGPTKSGLSWL